MNVYAICKSTLTSGSRGVSSVDNAQTLHQRHVTYLQFHYKSAFTTLQHWRFCFILVKEFAHSQFCEPVTLIFYTMTAKTATVAHHALILYIALHLNKYCSNLDVSVH